MEAESLQHCDPPEITDVWVGLVEDIPPKPIYTQCKGPYPMPDLGGRSDLQGRGMHPIRRVLRLRQPIHMQTLETWIHVDLKHKGKTMRLHMGLDRDERN